MSMMRGPQIAAMLKKLEIQSEFVHGLRVTDKPTVDVVEMDLVDHRGTLGEMCDLVREFIPLLLHFFVEPRGDFMPSPRLFAEAFNKDPEFFAFYRSMQAYGKALQGDDTTLVLKPDSEFFEFFGGKSQSASPTPAQ